MKRLFIYITTILSFTTIAVFAQGSFVFDQQSTSIIEGGATIQQGKPLGQSFTPTLSDVEFVQFYMSDAGSTSAGATVYVNLLATSITGTVLGTTTALSLPNQFGGVATFYFPSLISVTPGTTYYFEPIVQTGDPWNLAASDNSYTGGSAIYKGSADPGQNFYFSEGVVAAPEPSATWLAVLAGGTFLTWRRWRMKSC